MYKKIVGPGAEQQTFFKNNITRWESSAGIPKANEFLKFHQEGDEGQVLISPIKKNKEQPLSITVALELSCVFRCLKRP